MDKYSELLTGPLSKTAYMVLEAHEREQGGQNVASKIFLPALLRAQEEMSSLPEPLVAAFLLYACGPDNHETALRQFYDYTGHIDDVDVDETQDWFQQVLDFEDAIGDGCLQDQPYEFQMIYVALQSQYYSDSLNNIEGHGLQYYENLMRQIDQTIDLLDTLDEDVMRSDPAAETLALLRLHADYLTDVMNNGGLKNTFNRLDKKYDNLDMDDPSTLDSEPFKEDMEQLGLILSGEISNAAWEVVEGYPVPDNDDLFESIVPALVRLDETEGAPEALVTAFLLFSVKPEDRKSAITDFCRRFYETEPEAVDETLSYYQEVKNFFDSLEQGNLKGLSPILEQYYLARQDVYFEQQIEQGQVATQECIAAINKTNKAMETLGENAQDSSLFRANVEKMATMAELLKTYIEVKKTTERLKGDFKDFKKNKGRPKGGFHF